MTAVTLAATIAPPSGDAFAFVLLALAIILVAGKLGAHVAERLGQPAVLGELLAGVLAGNLDLLGIHGLDPVRGDATVDALAQLGALILLFDLGVEATVSEMLRVGPRSLVVAVLGVVTPWLLGVWVGAWLLPNHSVYVHVFVGAILTATSVGITARVLRDLDRAQSIEGRILLGAAVIDDVLGLVVLAAVTSLITAANLGTTVSVGALALVLGKALLFLGGAIALGFLLSPHLFRIASGLRGRGVLLATALVFCFVLAYVAWVIGLAPIVGAFAAGLILEDLHVRRFRNRGEQSLSASLRPISDFLVPVFFVVMGMRVELEALARPEVLGLALALTAAAMVGKQACALGALGGGLDWLSIGLGMIPRGEVGLIFANIGLGLRLHGERVVDDAVFSAVVVMVMATTLVTPPALKWSFARAARRRKPARARS